MALDIKLETTDKSPLFLQIATRIRSAIAAGQLSPGARLPSSRALAAQLAIARGTVDAAYAMLVGEGAIETRRPAGTIVSGLSGCAPMWPNNHLSSFQWPPTQHRPRHGHFN